MSYIDHTQLFGLFAFSLLVVSHLVATIKNFTNHKKIRKRWFTLSIIYSLMLIDIIGNFRHNMLRNIIYAIDLNFYYADRRPIQVIVLSILLLIFAYVINKLKVLQRWSRLLIAELICTFITALFVLEVISLHQIDSILYQQIGPALLIGWLWLFFSTVAATIVFKSNYSKTS